MFQMREKWLPSRLRPEFRFVRTLQSPFHVVQDEATGLYRISSKAFGPSSSDGTLSGDLEEVLHEDGLSATAMYPAVRDPVGAASVTIDQIRTIGAGVSHDPSRHNWYHGAVNGSKPKRIRNKLKDGAVEIIPIDQARAHKLFEKSLIPDEARKNSST
jgi:hypothetical protein